LAAPPQSTLRPCDTQASKPAAPVVEAAQPTYAVREVTYDSWGRIISVRDWREYSDGRRATEPVTRAVGQMPMRIGEPAGAVIIPQSSNRRLPTYYAPPQRFQLPTVQASVCIGST